MGGMGKLVCPWSSRANGPIREKCAREVRPPSAPRSLSRYSGGGLGRGPFPTDSPRLSRHRTTRDNDRVSLPGTTSMSKPDETAGDWAKSVAADAADALAGYGLVPKDQFEQARDAIAEEIYVRLCTNSYPPAV